MLSVYDRSRYKTSEIIKAGGDLFHFLDINNIEVSCLFNFFIIKKEAMFFIYFIKV